MQLDGRVSGRVFIDLGFRKRRINLAAAYIYSYWSLWLNISARTQVQFYIM